MHFSSYLRPTVNWQPGQRVWALTADTDLLRWLDSTGVAYDVITDDALHWEHDAVLEGYRVLVTGTHPEYYSADMREAVERFTRNGGRLMYLGGNGFYWKVAFSSQWPAAVELRRAEDGTRAWASPSGEYHHQFDGAPGGLWRRQGGQAPQQLVGVGFAAQGDGSRLRFRKTPAARDPRVAFIFEGVDEEVVADFKWVSQAGRGPEEVDRAAFDLGTPGHALVNASSEGRAAGLLRTKEELLFSVLQVADPDVRADIVFFETDNGGAVFSTGATGWSCVMAHRDHDNPAARMTTNVLRRFVQPEKFEHTYRDPSHEELTPQIHQAAPGLGVGQLPWRELLRTALARAVVILVLSVIAKLKGLPLMPVPPPRDEVLQADPARGDRGTGTGAIP